MIVSHKHQVVILHNPKVAGTSFRKVLQELHDDPLITWSPNLLHSRVFLPKVSPYLLDVAHLTCEEALAYSSKLLTYTFFALHRDPYARAVSAIEEFLRKNPQHQADKSLTWFKALTPASIERDCRFIHFKPQRFFVPPVTNGWGSTYPVEDIEKFLADVTKGTGLEVKLPYSPRVTREYDYLLEDPGFIGKINYLYAQDFQYLRRYTVKPFSNLSWLTDVDVANAYFNPSYAVYKESVESELLDLVAKQEMDVLE